MVTKTFEAAVRRQADLTIIDLHGEINAGAESALNAAYDEAAGTNPERILLNFRDVDYINSTGIALIVSLLAKSRKAHRTLSICGLSDHYIQIFQITRLSDFMHIYPDEATALAQ